MVFGSLTCPVTESAGGGLRELHARYGDRVRFVLVNVREAHPGALTPSDHSMRLKEHHLLPFEVATDDLDGTLHRAFGPRPSSAYPIHRHHQRRRLGDWAPKEPERRRDGRSSPRTGERPSTCRGWHPGRLAMIAAGVALIALI